MIYDWDWSILGQFRTAFLTGTIWTIVLSASAIVEGSAFGLLWGVLLTTEAPNWREVRWVAQRLSEIVRALPLLILLLLVNYTAPYALGLRSLFWISNIALALNLAAFIADVVRGAVSGVPRPLRDAGLSVGMTERQVLLRIVLPEAIRGVIPTASLLYIDILKLSSLASVIAFPELSHVGRAVSSLKFRPLEPLVLIALIYVAIVVPLSLLQRRLERSRWLVRRS